MIRVRIDDVMWASSAYEGGNDKAEQRFEQMHRWICQVPGKAFHVPTILVSEIQEFPNTINFIREETNAGRMFPQLHGFEHIDYGKLPKDEIIIHLKDSIEWFKDNIGIQPSIWATPWGACNDTMLEASKECHLELETTAGTIEFAKAIQLTKRDLSLLYDRTIFGHWWNKGLRLLRIVEIIKHGSYEEARKDRPDLFG